MKYLKISLFQGWHLSLLAMFPVLNMVWFLTFRMFRRHWPPEIVGSWFLDVLFFSQPGLKPWRQYSFRQICLKIDHGPCTAQLWWLQIDYSRSFTHFDGFRTYFHHFPTFWSFSHHFPTESRHQNSGPPPSPPCCHSRRQSPPPWLWPWSLPRPQPWQPWSVGNPLTNVGSLISNTPHDHSAEISQYPNIISFKVYISNTPHIKSFSCWNRRPIGQRDFGVRHPLRCKEKPWCQRLRFDFLSPTTGTKKCHQVFSNKYCFFFESNPVIPLCFFSPYFQSDKVPQKKAVSNTSLAYSVCAPMRPNLSHHRGNWAVAATSRLVDDSRLIDRGFKHQHMGR